MNIFQRKKDETEPIIVNPDQLPRNSAIPQKTENSAIMKDSVPKPRKIYFKVSDEK